ncbi:MULTISPECIES: phosphate/phosphite/phosphonate ABC transporter substrate-binding protein [Moorena]|uniref:ABC-type phosphate/phosphonate transport system, periplasmic component n=1 Tax=Moorena producens 3L TaxID=489825 RepID=F4XZ37_9CYAN|nr:MULTISPECIES: phosphate/phosphite/phosphonate ABC transporter substrate-binding protein [Moorena]NEQ12643.1 phosphate/phosphite/phosphonate ABC transporter substrate-binding protein [Moorena sp. SIO3E2]EGJ30153.1 ABC-type phosphate/phosphonate transport system, periplasmic component [Moorena producens 3L]NEP69533.1 phosphate/phosphite/phosphonate ABC transporter substrate-binding protein [Moorena sp. SIO3A5]NER91677.1 phosphate/phosphite/phosphonate ABC transporter substrate-binding protein 
MVKNIVNSISYQQTIIHLLTGVSIAIILGLTACENKNSANPSVIPVDTSHQQVSDNTVRVGVLIIDSVDSVKQRYQPLLNYLSGVINRPFSLVPVTQESQFIEVAQGNLHFTTNNPLAAVQIRRLYDTEFLLTHSRPQVGTKFGGLIIVRSDSNIYKLKDLRGKKAACVAFQTAAAGCIFQIYHLLQHGIDPFLDFSSFVENKSQDQIVLDVVNGKIDVGFIRTCQLEKMVNQGLLENLEQLRILESAKDEFFYTHTTELYPEWPIAAVKGTDPQLVAAVTEALLNIPPNHPALAAANIDKFLPAEDYGSLDKLIETLRLKSWDANRDPFRNSGNREQGVGSRE